ncbi:MAG: hypothetical protein QUV07_15165 [Cyanobium sp. CZS 25K]|nr:hypothetical protein [Cyanobium sp. CZS25K]
MYARSLSRLALVFGILYIVLVVSAAIPVRLLDYAWINRVTATLINGSSLPLLALLVLVLACILFPEDEILQKRRQLFCRLATVATLGFLLLVPLNTYMGVIQHLNDREQSRRLDDTARQLTTYRNAVASATSASTIQATLAQLGAPTLDAAALALPLPELKARLRPSLDLAAAQIEERRQALAAAIDWKARLTDLLRIVAASLALSFGFAAFAQPTPQAPPLLDGFEQNLARFRRRSLLRQWSRPDEDWLDAEQDLAGSAPIPRRRPRRSFIAGLPGSPQRGPESHARGLSAWQRLLVALNPAHLFGGGRNHRPINRADQDYFNAIASEDPPERR